MPPSASLMGSRQRSQGTLPAVALPLMLLLATAACVNAARPLPSSGRRLAQTGLYLSAILGNGDYRCPQGFRMVTFEEATSYSAVICAKLSALNNPTINWSTSRLANGGSIDGPGMNCRVRQTEPRTDLATTLCVPGAEVVQPTPSPTPSPVQSFIFGVPQPSPSPRRSPSPRPSPTPECVDKATYCNMYVVGNLCNNAIIGAREQCAKSCGFCSTPVQPAPVPSPVPSPTLAANPTPSPTPVNGGQADNSWVNNFLNWGSNPTPVTNPDPAPVPQPKPVPVPSPVPVPVPSPRPSVLPTQPVNPTPAPSGDWMGELLRLVNGARRQVGQPDLCYNAKLNLASQQQSDSGSYGHTWSFILALDYNWGALGQNIARGQTTVQQVFDAWMNSPKHYENIISNEYTQMGVGWNRGATMWTQNFGASETEPCS